MAVPGGQPRTVVDDGVNVLWPLVYLDQWVWIRLSRAALGHTDAVDAAEPLKRLPQLVSSNLIVCALSNIHYMETHAHNTQARRLRLGKLMVELSHLTTLAPPQRDRPLGD